MKKTESKDNLIEFAINSTFEKEGQIKCRKHRISSEGYTNYNANLNDDLVIIFSGHVKAEKGYDYSFTNFPFYRIVYTASGHAVLRYPGKEIMLKSGTVCGFAPDDKGEISVNSDSPWEHYYLHFTGKDASKIFSQTMLNTKRAIYTSNPPKFLQYFENIIEEERNDFESSHIINVYYLKILMLKLAYEIYNNTEDHSLASRETYLTCRNYINKHFSEINSFEELADKCNISKVYFCRLFKQYAEISPMAYVMNLKMNKAAVLLMQSDLSIKQISHVLSFEDQYYFSKLFKKKYGISPKYYRQKHSLA
jgi:AraC-like DNA-binding protein